MALAIRRRSEESNVEEQIRPGALYSWTMLVTQRNGHFTAEEIFFSVVRIIQKIGQAGKQLALLGLPYCEFGRAR